MGPTSEEQPGRPGGRGVGAVKVIGGMRRRLAVRVALVVVLVSVAAIVVMGVVVTRALRAHALDAVESRLRTAARLVQEEVAAALATEAPPRIQAMAERHGARSGARITVLQADGTVVGDSGRAAAAVPEMENHASRPEVAAALAGRAGRDVRWSRSLGVHFLYVAVPLEARGRVEGVLRLAVPLTEVDRDARFVHWTVLGAALLALAIAVVAGVLVSLRVTRPVLEIQAAARRLADGDLTGATPASADDEVADLGRTLDLVALRFRDKLQNLESERARATAILDSMVEGVIAVDERDHVLLLNPGARAIFGLGDEPVEGRPFLEVIRHKELYDLAGECRADGGGSARREVDLGPPRNRVLAVQAVAVAFTSPAQGALLVLHDVTELRRLERVKTEFVANVSHELRTPLTAIRGYLETLLDGAIDEPANARRFLQVASTHAERLSRLVDDLLQLSNIETGKVALAPEPLGLAELADGLVAMFEDPAARSGVTVAHEVPAPIVVRADRDRLAQILVNLLDNAVKYTPAGGRIRLSARTVASERVEVEVVDTGIGIPSTDLPRLTERFYRVDKARSRELGGTGLGLAIVKHLVQAHGGELYIDSALGQGTTVRFTLPTA
jgi:two-component system phosphate regulon sensor histidine kinase PhoR